MLLLTLVVWQQKSKTKKISNFKITLALYCYGVSVILFGWGFYLLKFSTDAILKEIIK